jgi:integrase
MSAPSRPATRPAARRGSRSRCCSIPGQRRSDVVRLGPQHIKDGWITITQAKNKVRKPVTLSIPLLPELETVMDATPTGNLAFLVTQFGKPFTPDGFGNVEFLNVFFC